jgi:uncharacterized repeat protein (TIGR03833 family)
MNTKKKSTSVKLTKKSTSAKSTKKTQRLKKSKKTSLSKSKTTKTGGRKRSVKKRVKTRSRKKRDQISGYSYGSDVNRALENEKILASDKSIKVIDKAICGKLDDRSTNPKLGLIKPKPGDSVIMITKPYGKLNCYSGVVKQTLTSKPTHTRGHKVMLENGIIGRTLQVL